MGRKRSLNAEVEWRRRLSEFRRLDLTVAEYCDREGISNPSFYRWRQRLEGDRGSKDRDGRKSAKPSRSKTSKHFVEINIADTEWAEIELPNGVRIRVPANNLEALRVAVLVGGEQNSGGSSC